MDSMVNPDGQNPDDQNADDQNSDDQTPHDQKAVDKNNDDQNAEDKNAGDPFPFTPHPTDPDGVILPPPTQEQMAKGRIACKVYDREDWGGRPPRETPVMYTPVSNIVLSRTETDSCFTHEDCKLKVRELQNMHMDQEGEPDIKYHFLVGGDGALYEGRGYTTAGQAFPETPNKLQELSKNCLEIAFIQRSDTESSKEMQNVASDCITLGRYANYIYKTCNLYFVANNDIVYKETVGEVERDKENEKKLIGDSSRQESPDQGKQVSSSSDQGTLGLETDKNEVEEPNLIEMDEVDEYVPHSNVPIDEDSREDRELPEVKPVKVINRHEWGAKSPKWIKALNLPISRVAVTYTETDPCHTEEECIQLVKKIQIEHLKSKKEPDIKHNFLIGGDGQIYEGRGYTRVGPIYAASKTRIEQLNEKCIDIGLIGKHEKQPSQEMIGALSWCISAGIHKKYIEKKFDSYYIANNEIVHIQRPVVAAKSE